MISKISERSGQRRAQPAGRTQTAVFLRHIDSHKTLLGEFVHQFMGKFISGFD